jgi:hypothetical protein
MKLFVMQSYEAFRHIVPLLRYSIQNRDLERPKSLFFP